MVSQDSPPNLSSTILNQPILSNSISGQTQFTNQYFEPYTTDLRGICEYPRIATSLGIVHAPQMAEESDMNHSRHLMDLLGASNESNHQPQRVPLSHQYRQSFLNSNLSNPHYLERDDYTILGNPFESSFSLAIANSKYLKPSQSLLEEVVSIGGKDIVLSNEKYIRRLSKNSRRGSMTLCSELNSEVCNNGLSAEKHELQIKIAKLVALLEEVERRYGQYYNHMEEVVSSFEVLTGLGAGKLYTSLALQAISRHFNSLRDAIISQINASRRKIVQDLPKLNMGLSQLSLFDSNSRHNGLSQQHFLVIQSQKQVWRPIRGLPENSVTILRSWLFEHFLHPYPNDSEKLMLASQTGLTKNQVSNWFINARVRLWKPMIEEMYKEEFADSSDDSNPLQGNSSLSREDFTDHAE